MKPARCKFCNNHFIPRRKIQKLCSNRCASLYGWSLPGHRKSIKKKCLTCAKSFLVPPNRIKDGKGKFCSKKCYVAYQRKYPVRRKHSSETKDKLSKKRIGQLNPAWKGGTSYGIRYNGLFPRRLKEKILKRDKYKCQACGSPKKLCVHHIDFNHLNSDEDNLVVLCRACHSSLHRVIAHKVTRFIKVPNNDKI